jgi:hypothetical protein
VSEIVLGHGVSYDNDEMKIKLNGKVVKEFKLDREYIGAPDRDYAMKLFNQFARIEKCYCCPGSPMALSHLPIK